MVPKVGSPITFGFGYNERSGTVHSVSVHNGTATIVVNYKGEMVTIYQYHGVKEA